MLLKLIHNNSPFHNIFSIWRYCCLSSPPIYNDIFHFLWQNIRMAYTPKVDPESIMNCIQLNLPPIVFLMFHLSTPNDLTTPLLLLIVWLDANVQIMSLATSLILQNPSK